MKITYINHSGFLVETRDCYYIFDYYKGELPNLDKEKEVIVFCSHFHKDHFNPQIFGILDDMGMTYQAILANDIRKRNHLSDMKITYVYHDQAYSLDNETKVDTLLSNDSGVA
ncbi:MAG: MBL fold metallo-hydrolase, partial [Blautia wexlerae]